MNDDTINKQIEIFTVNMKYTQAINFVLNRKYKLADALLFELISNFGELPQILNLYASSLAQQGRFSEAKAYWEKALKIQPENLHFQKAIDKIYELQKKRFLSLQHLSTVLKFALGILTVLFVIWSLTGNIKLNNNMQELTSKQNKILKAISLTRNEPKKISPALSSIPKIAAAIHQNISGISLVENNNSATITFNNGLFDRGSKLKNVSKVLLANFANLLKPYSGQFKLIIFGCTNDVPVSSSSKYQDNISLAGTRAEIVFNVLHDSAKVAPEDMLIGSCPEANAPFSNITYMGREKNKTVIIKLFPNNLQY